MVPRESHPVIAQVQAAGRHTSGVNGGSPFSAPRTGNVAFDAWREKELTRLDEERRRLHEAEAEFAAYARELRRAKDQQEFDRFMAERGKRHDDGPVVDGQPA